MVPPNQLTVGVLAATHAMSATAHSPPTALMPKVNRPPPDPGPAIMLTTAAPTASAVANHSAAVAPAARAAASASQLCGCRTGRARGTARPTPMPVTTAIGHEITPRGVTATSRADAATSSAPHHAARGRGTNRATRTATVPPTLIATTEVMSAAPVFWVPQLAAGIATAAN